MARLIERTRDVGGDITVTRCTRASVLLHQERLLRGVPTAQRHQTHVGLWRCVCMNVLHYSKCMNDCVCTLRALKCAVG